MSFDDKDGAGQATDIPHKEDKNDQVENIDRSDSLYIYFVPVDNTKLFNCSITVELNQFQLIVFQHFLHILL